MSKTLYISDLDGTLLNASAELTEYTMTSLNTMIADGLHFTIATARTLASSSKILAGLTLDLPIALMNGVLVYDMAQKCYTQINVLEPKTVVSIIQTLRTFDITGFMYKLNNGELITFHESLEQKPLRDFVEERVTRYYKSFQHTEGFDSISPDNIIYFTLLDTYERIQSVYGEIAKRSDLNIAFYKDNYSPNLWYLEVFSVNASKQNAVDYLRTEYGYERIIGFGDNLNDLPMFAACDVKIAVKNAKEEVAEAADHICGANVDDGVAKWIEKNRVSTAKNTDIYITEALQEGYELQILITDADKFGTEIAEMSDFFDGYIQQLSCDLRKNSIVVGLDNVPVADIGIINDVVHQMDAVIDGCHSYLPDFDHLPRDIKSKLDRGIYKLGESRQVDGNLRPVILDENGVRVKDITLKEVMNDHGTMETTRNVVSQLQMRQLFAKLDSMQELQSYQIDRDRDRDIVTPFLNARDQILRAQNQDSIEDKRGYISKAVAELTSAINAVYTDMETSVQHVLKLTKWPIFQRSGQIKNYIEFLTRDVQLVTKFIGVQTQVLNYLGDNKSANLELERYRHIIHEFFSKPLGTRKISAAMLIHQYFPYIDENRNCWIALSKEISAKLQSRIDSLDCKKIYLVSAEDTDDGE